MQSEPGLEHTTLLGCPRYSKAGNGDKNHCNYHILLLWPKAANSKKLTNLKKAEKNAELTNRSFPATAKHPTNTARVSRQPRHLLPKVLGDAGGTFYNIPPAL